MDLIVICSLGVLMNVLCPATYSAPGLHCLSKMDNIQADAWDQYDINGLSEYERKIFCLVRGQSLELVLWLSATYVIGNCDSSAQDVFLAVVVNMCKALCDYKWKADKQGIFCSPDFTIERLKTQIHNALSLVYQTLGLPFPTPELNVMTWELPMTDPTFYRILPQIAQMSIHRSSAPEPYQRKSQADLCKMGETVRDRNFGKRLEVKAENGSFSNINGF